MIRLTGIAAVLLTACVICSCGNKNVEETESIVYNYDEIKGIYNKKITSFYNSLEDYKKTGAKVFYFDIDNNNVPELFLSQWEGEYEVYTVNDGEAVLCGSVEAPLYKTDENELVSVTSFGSSAEGCRKYTLTDNAVKSELLFEKKPDGTESLPQTEDGGQIKTYNELKEEYSKNSIEGNLLSENIEGIDNLFPEM